MSIFDKLQTLASNITAGGDTGSGSTQNAGSSNATDNEVSVFSNKSNSNSNSNSLTQIDDEDFLWWQERLEEKKEQEESESFDSSKYSSDEWNTADIKENKVLGISSGTYTYKSSSGVKITLEDTKGVKILENKKTGEIVVVGANGATINAGNKDAKITIYDSDIKKLDTDKGNDEVKIYNSNVGEITTGRGVDNVVIENSQVEKVNTGSGSDTVNIKDSSIGNANTSSSFLWGVFDDAEDTVTLVDSEADKVKTGKGDDSVIASDSDIDKLKTGGGSDSLNIDNTDVNRLRTNKEDTVIEDSNYLDVDKTKILELGKDAIIDLGDGNTISVNEYSQYLLSQPIGFETEEEYQNYVLQSLTSNLETMKSVFGTQSDKDGWVAGGYNGLKELTGLGITDKDIEEMIAKQEEMVAGLTAAMNGESDMSFEEAYEYYTGTTYSKEKIDKYMEVSNIYSAVMVGCQYDENYIEEFEAATGMSVEDVTKEYALCQLDTFGKSTGLQDLAEKYSQDQEAFADKLSAAITTVGMTCIVVGAVVSFVFPPAAPVGAALMTAGKYVSLGGMFVDNAMDLVDDTTDKDGLTKEELSENALETGVEVVSYATGRAIGGLTNNINTAVSSAATQAGASNVTSYIAGQAAETTADMILSLGADYAIAQGQSLITTGEFMDSSEYWSLDRFLGEGKNQLIGILTGLSSAKINNPSGQAAVYATAGKMVLDGDSTGARAYLETSGVKVDDTSFDDFQRTVIEANPDASVPKLETPKENNAPEIEVDKPVEADTSIIDADVQKPVEGNSVVDADSQKPIDTESSNTQTPKIEIPERTSKYKDLSIEEKRQLVNEKIEDKRLAEKFAAYPEEKLAQVLDLKDMGLSEREILWSVNKNLNQQQFNTLTHLLESGYSRDSAIDLATVEPSKLDTAIELTNKGLRTNLLDKVLNLESSEYSRATELLDLGITDSTIMKYVKLDDSSYSKVIDLLKVGLTDITDGYEIQRRLNLSDSEFEAEIQKLKQIQSMRQESSTPAEIKPIKLSVDEVQELVTYLNEHGQTCSIDDGIEDLAWKWEQVYRTSGYTPNVLNPKIEDAMITRNRRYTMPDTETGGRSSSSLNRWMFVSDMDSFINGLPEVGGIYSPNRIQSFSTIKHDAETSFSDFNPNNNVKIVVLPANRTTSAFQIENKYNSNCEVIYPSTTQFRVLYKGVEEYPRDFSCDPTKGSHQMYTIYLEEVIPDTLETIDPATKYSDTEIPDVAINQQLSSNAVALNKTFEEHIGEVEQSTRNRFSGLKSVNADNITARAKSDKSTFEKIASKFKSGKLASTDIATCSEAIGDAYGTRIQMNSVDTDVAKTTITKALDGTGITYEQFVGYVTGKATFDEVTTQKLSEIKAPVLDTLKTAQSQEVVDRLVHVIEQANPNDPPVITELNNYGGTVSSYFTDAQLEQVASAYSKKYGKPLDIVTKLDTQNLPVGEYSVDLKDGKYISRVESSTAKYTDKGATKDSGYTSSQMNTKHKLSDGTIGNGELQIRGTEVNAFADVEHIPYDIRQGKIKPDDPKYATVYNLIKGMNDTTYEAYNRYLTAVYDTLRLKELGIPVDGEPDIKTFMKDSGLSNADLDLLSRSGLEKLH